MSSAQFIRLRLTVEPSRHINAYLGEEHKLIHCFNKAKSIENLVDELREIFGLRRKYSVELYMGQFFLPASSPSAVLQNDDELFVKIRKVKLPEIVISTQVPDDSSAVVRSLDDASTSGRGKKRKAQREKLIENITMTTPPQKVTKLLNNVGDFLSNGKVDKLKSKQLQVSKNDGSTIKPNPQKQEVNHKTKLTEFSTLNNLNHSRKTTGNTSAAHPKSTHVYFDDTSSNNSDSEDMVNGESAKSENGPPQISTTFNKVNDNAADCFKAASPSKPQFSPIIMSKDGVSDFLITPTTTCMQLPTALLRPCSERVAAPITKTDHVSGSGGATKNGLSKRQKRRLAARKKPCSNDVSMNKSVIIQNKSLASNSTSSSTSTSDSSSSDEELTTNRNKSAISLSSAQNSFEKAGGHKEVVSEIPATKNQTLKSNQWRQPTKPIESYPILKLPTVRAGDFVAFKMLELSDDCSPEISDWKIAKVLSFDQASNCVEVEMKRRSGGQGPSKLQQLFSNEEEDETSPNIESGAAMVDNEELIVLEMLRWESLIEPRLID